MGKSQQIIYTRCRPRRAMDGKVVAVKEGGYGIYSLSQGLAERCSVRESTFLVSMLDEAKDINDAFLYWVPRDSDPMLAFHHFRPGEEDPDCFDRNKLVAINQGFIGSFDEHYPCDAFSSAAFGAHKRSWREFYDNGDGVPAELLPEVDDSELFSDMGLRPMVEAFIRDGRVQALRDALWMVLRQLAAQEPMPLIIRDEEQNVRLWIAAIEYALPRRLASKIGFSTGMTGLNTGIGANIYSVNPSTGECYREAADGLPRQLRYLLIGVDPKDGTSVTTANPAPGCGYAVLDGAAKKALFEAGDTTASLFYQRLSNMPCNDQICQAMDENLQSIGLHTPVEQLYEVFVRIMSSSQWQYATLLEDLKILDGQLQQDAVLGHSIVQQLCNQYPKLAEEDLRNGLWLMSYLWRKACGYPQQNYTGRVQEIVVACLRQQIESRSAQKLSAFIAALHAVDGELYGKVIQSTLGGEGLKRLSGPWIESAAPEYATAIVQLLLDHLRASRQPISEAVKDPATNEFLTKLLGRVGTDQRESARLLQSQAGDSGQLMKLVRLGGMAVNDTARAGWWRAAMSVPQIKVSDICGCVSEMHQDGDIEPLLADQFRTGNDLAVARIEELYRAYETYCSRQPNAGGTFYRTWCDYVMRARDGFQAMDLLLKRLPNNVQSTTTKDVYQRLDDALPLDREPATLKMAQRLAESAKLSGADADRAKLIVFLDHALSAHGEKGLYKVCVQEGYDIFAVRDFARSELCRRFLKTVAVSQQPEVHLAGILVFDFGRLDRERMEYYRLYARQVTESSPMQRNRILAALAQAYDVCIAPEHYQRNQDYNPMIGDVSAEDLVAAGREIWMALGTELSEARWVASTVKKIGPETRKQYPTSNAADHLEELLAQAAATYQKNHTGGSIFTKITGLFGRKD